MNVRAESNIALDLTGGQIDYGLMKAVLEIISKSTARTSRTHSISDVIRYEGLSINVWWLLAIVFRL